LGVSAKELETVATRFGLQPEQHGHVRPLLGLNPGAEYGPAKRWPIDRFVLTAVDVQRQTKCRWLVFGGHRDIELANEITQRIAALCKEFTHYSSAAAPPLNLAGKTTLRDLCVLLKLCRVLLTNDTGPMHVAAAVGTPVVVPFGSTSWGLTGPGLPGDPRHQFLKGNAPCAPCFRRECPIDLRCMTSIAVTDAIDAVLRAIAPPDEPGRDI
jgi:heptosyltransferase II